MTKLGPMTVYVPRKGYAPIDHCGPECGYFCIGGRCNRFAIGEPIRPLPTEMPGSGFPEWCHLTTVPAAGELFEVKA